MANLNLFLSPYKILLIAQENKYLRKSFYFIIKLYVEYSLELPIKENETILTSTLNIQLSKKKKKNPLIITIYFLTWLLNWTAVAWTTHV